MRVVRATGAARWAARMTPSGAKCRRSLLVAAAHVPVVMESRIWHAACDYADFMRFMSRAIAMVMSVVMTGALTSCAVHGNVGRADLMDPSTAERFHHFRKPPGQSVMSYSTTDGAVHAFEGRAWIEGDSVVFEERGREFVQTWDPGERRSVAIADLASVEAVDENSGATFVAAVGVIGAVVGIVYLTIQATWGSLWLK